VTGCVFVPGKPVPQGSSKAFVGAAKTWHPDRIPAGLEDARPLGDVVAFPGYEPVRLGLLFVMPRAQSEPKRTRPHTRKPDADKLTRAILDALSGTLFRDDSQVVGFGWLEKRTAELGEQSGAHITWWQGSDRRSDPPYPDRGSRDLLPAQRSDVSLFEVS